jgi:uncharacterized protein
MVPDPGTCREILHRFGVPEHIRRHSEQVARVARSLAAALGRAGEPVDGLLVEAGALLHDIAKAASLVSNADHALEGGRILRGLGYPKVAELVERHVKLGAWETEGRVTEAELLNYSDKRVRHDEVVTLSERFEDLLVRWGAGDEGACARIRADWKIAAALEVKIFAKLPFPPEAMDLRRG